LDQIIDKQSIQFNVDAEIPGFFNQVYQEWLLEFLKLRVGDNIYPPHLFNVKAGFTGSTIGVADAVIDFAGSIWTLNKQF
jgi:hypothetical protein